MLSTCSRCEECDTCIRILLVDDREVVTAGIQSWLENRRNIRLFFAQNNMDMTNCNIEQIAPQMVIQSIINNDENDAARLCKLIIRNKGVKFLILLDDVDKYIIRNLLEAGVRGLVSITCSRSSFLDSVDTVLDGNLYMCSKIACYYYKRYNTEIYRSGHKKERQLTGREYEVLKLISSGKTIKQISEELFISEKTVCAHRYNLSKKLDCHSTAMLTQYAIRTGIIQI